jgi:uncharacterized protein YuzE
MKITYDPVADALYIRLKAGVIAKTKEEGVCLVDYDAEGGVLGIEVLQYSKYISPIEPAEVLKYAL